VWIGSDGSAPTQSGPGVPWGAGAHPFRHPGHLSSNLTSADLMSPSAMGGQSTNATASCGMLCLRSSCGLRRMSPPQPPSLPSHVCPYFPWTPMMVSPSSLVLLGCGAARQVFRAKALLYIISVSTTAT